MPTALIRRPSQRLAEGLVTHIERRPVDLGLAFDQWQRYVDALHDTGWHTVEVPPIDECPDSVFIEDTMVVYGDLAVIARAGADERRAEATAAEATVAEQGYRIARIDEPRDPRRRRRPEDRLDDLRRAGRPDERGRDPATA